MSDRTSPFSIYLTNLGKYNEGELVGEWIPLPTERETLAKLLRRIQIDGVRYEEYFITDYDVHLDGLSNFLGETENIDELNFLAGLISGMQTHQIEVFEAVIECGYMNLSGVSDLINLSLQIDDLDIALYHGIHSEYDLGEYCFIEFGHHTGIPENYHRYIDFEAIGRDFAMEASGDFTKHGFIEVISDFPHIYGGIDDIPEEYRIFTYPDPVPLLDKPHKRGPAEQCTKRLRSRGDAR